MRAAAVPGQRERGNPPLAIGREGTDLADKLRALPPIYEFAALAAPE